MSITVCKIFSFSAAHHLPNYLGPCSNLHGHNWKLEIGITGPIDTNGFVMDFKEIKNKVTKRILSVVDHKYLNAISKVDSYHFPRENPTAENMIHWMIKIIEESLYGTGKQLAFIRLWETENSYAEWRNK